MSFRLDAGDGRTLRINVWNWGVLHHFVERAGVLPADVWEPKRHNGGGTLAPGEVVILADFLERELLPRLRPGERLFYDGSVTDAPDDGTFYREESELWKNYSLSHEMLLSVIELLRSARGEVEIS